ncbi:hypothetical protein HN51_058029 [Arachis hypogaea]|uniref:Bifunctional inhibitor/plant lipid transfer protein/seed storage helical domain-containing protein n=1 Tax=Arachis hypogaea TaxID=3818 RepID=A0A444WZD9_ARAHY|nr:non-specific lipid-transfer protein-like protein At2g13820 isoform X1 [Arachis ipaensis]XP_016179451.1 non-specific lipid-transfer protein-like protein At2g13820 isoform X1 [Arachis ipaensis]XP_025685866.1 non-specific lipid-transfer protein-like protein At2g13820 isoform X1 [Arachis hypogaea]RYQ82712.1 hypothetical protein Ahy_B10g101282 [Arachis hypogaea]
MAAKLSLSFIILCVVGAVMCDGARSPSPSVDCSNLVLTMADCLSFVTNGSTTTKPEGTCCSGLKTVLKTAPDCLCEAFKSSVQFGVVLNVTKALALPSACGLSASSATDYCGLSGAPAASPGGGRVSPGSSPSSASGSETTAPSWNNNGPINEVSPRSAPSSPSKGKSSASTMFPISPASLFLPLLLLPLFSLF